jgi:hypothetical protein
MPAKDNHHEPEVVELAKTENFIAWRSDEPDGESIYHLEILNITVHFYKEEWDEFLDLVHLATTDKPASAKSH